MRTQVIIPAAGQGSRLNAKVPKPLIPLNGKPIILHSVEIFDSCELIEGIVVAVPEEHRTAFEDVFKTCPLKKPLRLVNGGKTRSESVANALKTIDPNTDFVAVHDGARPLLSREVLESTIRAAYLSKAVIAAVPVKPTLKRVDPATKDVTTTMDRSVLWEAQTPQVFAYELLTQAHRQGVGLEATDDAFLVERYGARVKVVMGDYRNLKITTTEDLRIAQALLESP